MTTTNICTIRQTATRHENLNTSIPPLTKHPNTTPQPTWTWTTLIYMKQSDWEKKQTRT